MNEVTKFCEIIRKRSSEHTEAMGRLHGLHGMMTSILRQELDSMVRVIFLLNIEDLDERRRLISLTLDGQKWTLQTQNGKQRKVTDRDMVDIANDLQGWTSSVYNFGCAFIHLSNFHDYSASNPFDALSSTEQRDILHHMRHYHFGPYTDHPSFNELAFYFPDVYRKIASNLESYVKNLESNQLPQEG